MMVRSLNDELVTWNISGTKYPLKSEGACRSKLQYQIGQLLKEKYPFDTILEDVTLPHSRLSLDFFLPQRKIAVEVQGSQHEERSSFFHETMQDFFKQQSRDDQKKYFCELNQIQLFTFSSLQEAKAYFHV